MATYNPGITGAFSGKIGGVVASNWRKVSYFRSQGKASKKPATIEQLSQRTRLALCTTYLSPIKDVIRLGYSDKNLGKLSGYNAAARMFMATAITGIYPDFMIDFSAFKISKGPLTQVFALNMVATADNMTLSWKSILNKYTSFVNDKVMVVVYNETKSMYFIFDSATRGEETFVMETGADFSGDTLHVWCFTIKFDETATSPSQYAGSVTLA